MVYHCISRTVNGEFLFSPEDREVLRKQIWQLADFCGVQVLTYAILSNHFHVLVRVPQAAPIPDEELFRRYAVLFPKPTRHRTARLEVLKRLLESGDPEGVRWRDRILRMMGDVSNYLKLLKQRFSISFNKRHNRYGTLWSERFKSLIVEESGALRTVAAYIDLNCVRAGLASDPKDYRFCGYAEAVSGDLRARSGLEHVVGDVWVHASAMYRALLFAAGAEPVEGKGRIAEETAARVLVQQGELSLPTLLRCRIRYFSDGAILGTQSFVKSALARSIPGLQPATRPRAPRPVFDEGPLAHFFVARAKPPVSPRSLPA